MWFKLFSINRVQDNNKRNGIQMFLNLQITSVYKKYYELFIGKKKY